MLSLKTIRSRISRYSGAFLMSLVAGGSRSRTCPEEPESICILAQEKLGDAILLIPLFKELKRCFPSVSLTIIASRKNDSFLQSIPFVDEVYNPKSSGKSFHVFARQRSFDILYNPKDHPSRTFLIMTLLIKAVCKIGFKHAFSHRFYDIALEKAKGLPIVELNLRLLSLFSEDIPDSRIAPADLPVSHVDDAMAYFQTFARPIIGLNLSAGSPEREWSKDRWESLIARISPENATLFLFGMSDKSEMINSLISRYTHVISHHPLRSIAEVHGYMRNLDGFITPDTSLLHIALINGIRTVGLFTNNMENIKRFYTPADTSRIIISRSSSIRDIEPADVLQKLKEIFREL